MERYELDWLEEEFTRHADEYMKSPHYKSADFNLPVALKTLVMEIRSLQRVVQDAQIRVFLKDSATYLAPEEGSTEANT